MWNRSPEKAEELVELGAVPATSPANAARRAEVVITVVAEPAALRAVTEGPDGIAAGADGSTTVIEMSTVGPLAIRWLASALPARDRTAGCPPSSAACPRPRTGRSWSSPAAPADFVERLVPLLADLGSVLVAGPLGSGAAAKLVANATLVGSLTLLGETTDFKDRMGLGRDLTMDILASTRLSLAAKRRRDQLETGEFPLRFRLALRPEGARADPGARGRRRRERPRPRGGRGVVRRGRRSGPRRPGLLDGPVADHREGLSRRRPVLFLASPDPSGPSGAIV